MENITFKGKELSEVIAERGIDIKTVWNTAIPSLENSIVIVKRTYDSTFFLNVDGWTEADIRTFIAIMCNHHWGMRLHAVSGNIYYLV